MPLNLYRSNADDLTLYTLARIDMRYHLNSALWWSDFAANRASTDESVVTALSRAMWAHARYELVMRKVARLGRAA
jgi:hypothetical protein